MFAGVPELPAEADENTPVWIYAIAKCVTHALRESYVIVKVNFGKSPVITQAFNTDGVAKITSIHPYKFLEAHFVPKFTRAAETNQYIAEAYGVPLASVQKRKKEERLRLFYSHCVKKLLEYEKEQLKKREE